MDKKKATEKISIPLLLDVGEVIASTGVTLPEGAPTAPDGSPVSSLPVLTPVANPGHVLPASDQQGISLTAGITDDVALC